MSQSILSLLSSRSFIISSFTCQSVIYFEFILYIGWQKCSNFILLHVAVEFSQYHLLKRLYFLCYLLFHCCTFIDHKLGLFLGEGNGNPLQYSCLENPVNGGAWWADVHGETKSQTWLSDFTFTFSFHALEEEMATHSNILAWRILGRGSLVDCCLWGCTESDTTEAT